MTVVESDKAKENDTYKIEYEIMGIQKEEAFEFINKIHALFNRYTWTHAVTDYGILNERTGHYSHMVTDKY